MPYPKNIEQKIEFDQIRALIAEKCISETGAEYVAKMRFANRYDIVEKMLVQTAEMHRLLSEGQQFPADHYYNIKPYLNKAGIEGTFLLEEEWFKLVLMLQTVEQVCRFMDDKNEEYPQLAALFSGVIYNQHLAKRIKRIIDDEGNLRPNASPELSNITSKIAAKEKEVRKRMQRIYEQALEKGWLASSGITIREGRLVLPVLSEHKRQLSGFIHDESSTGQTVYLEPTEILESNNFIKELYLQYKRERERILVELTNELRPHIPELDRYVQRLGIIDFIRAKALFALSINAEMPILSKQMGIMLADAIHPLLKLSHAKLGLPVIPLSVHLTPENRILVVSGPNAGGKSVALKTIALLQYMIQCGLLVPCKSHSELSVFQDIFVDIGDEQSIENDLSTYSSHLKNMKYFTEFASNKSLFLIDEFGTGTDPQFGGPLAEAILHALNDKKSFGVVNTHYSNLKNYAGQTKGLINGRMLFDQTQLQPLYRLEVGQPGSSYAFEIAHKTGLHQHIIAYAKQKVGDKQKRVDDLLIELEREKSHVETLKSRFEEKNKQVNELKASYEKLKAELETNKKKWLNEAKLEALSIISEANSTIEQTIREIKEKKADTTLIRQIKSDLQEKRQILKKDTEQVKTEQLLETKNAAPNQLPIVKGATVKMIGGEVAGEVVEITGNKVLVTFGELKSWVDEKKLIAVKITKAPVKIQQQTSVDLNAKLQQFQTELQLIGVRGEDAMKKLQEYMDDAYTLGFKQVRIVHGKGYGILRKLVRDYLKSCSFVERVHDEHIEMGGDGISIVHLK